MAIVSSGQITLTDLNDSKQLVLYLNTNYRTQIYDPNTGSYSPSFTSSNLVITPELYIAGGDGANLLPTADVTSLEWFEGTQTTSAIPETSGTTYAIPAGAVGSTAKPLTVKQNFTNKNNQIFTCQLVYLDPDTGFEITIKAQVDIVKIVNGEKGNAGANAVIGYLTNQSAVVATNSSGTGGVYGDSTKTQLKIFEGTNDITSSYTISQARTNVTVTEATTSATASVTNLTADTGSVTFTATRSGYPTITQTFNLSKSKQGTAGNSPTAYWLVPSTAVIQKSEAGALTPSSISIDMKYQTGTGSPGFYGGRLVIAEQASNGTWSDKYTSSGNETGAKSYTPSGNTIKAIRVRMYQSGVTPNGTTNMIDEQHIVIVSDGNTGKDSHYLNVWAPNGDTIRNGSGSITIEAELYKGAGTVTPSSIKWYIQDPEATVASGGDSDGGDGWRKLTSTTNYNITGYTTDTIVVPASAINGVEGFKCVASYSSETFSGVIVVRDFQDPISVQIIGSSVFKNGVGSTSLTAQLVRAGEVIPTTGYTFAWALYKADGTLIKTYTATGDTLTVSASDVSGTANLVVDVSK
jgi:hypothetical protein